MSYVIVAEFRIKPGATIAFLDKMKAHAERSRAEPGCHLFEVAQDTTEPRHIILYERYVNEAAYRTHRATAHYARFLEWAPPLLEGRDGQLFQRRSVLTEIV